MGKGSVKQPTICHSTVPSVIADEDLSAMLSRLPSWRREKALLYRRPLDRYLCAEAYFLLESVLGKSLCRAEWGYSPSSKPFIPGHPEIHFSLSHCERCVACAVAPVPVGIDVETLQYDPSLAQMVCSAEEMALIDASASPEEAFTSLWTRKESYLKMTGEGLRDDLKSVPGSDSRCITDTRIAAGEGYALSWSMRI